MLSYEAKNLFRRPAFLNLNVHRNIQSTDTIQQQPHMLACFMMLQFPHESVVAVVLAGIFHNSVLLLVKKARIPGMKTG